MDVFYRIGRKISRFNKTNEETIEELEIIKKEENYYELANRHCPECNIIIRKEELLKPNAVFNSMEMEVYVWSDLPLKGSIENIRVTIDKEIKLVLDHEKKVYNEYIKLMKNNKKEPICIKCTRCAKEKETKNK